jgi:hypothetical protein
MTNLKTALSAVLGVRFSRERASSPTLADARFDRIDLDLIGASDTDAMWYYEMRKWRGRD